MATSALRASIVALSLFAAATSHAAITITDISPFSRPPGPPGTPLATASISGRMLAVAVSADGTRVYAASENAGLWRSVDGGQTWCQLSSVPVGLYCPDELASAIPVPVIADVAVSPVPSNGTVVLAAAAYDTRVRSLAGIYRSEDGGGTWHRVHEFLCGRQVQPALQVRFAPDDPNIVYASGGCSVAKSLNGGVTWEDTSPGAHVHAPGGTGVVGDVSIYHLAISERPVNERTGAVGHRWVYACSPSGLFYSRDEGHTWKLQSGYSVLTCGGFARTPYRLATEPGRPSRVYIARAGDNLPSIAPIFFDPGDPKTNRAPLPDGSLCTFCGEGKLWYANFDNFNNPAAPVQLSSPPVYFGDGTGSGASFVVTAGLGGPGNFLVFFGDEDTVHVHQGPISETGFNLNAGWHRLDGYDPWAYQFGGTRGNFLHVDPFGIAVSPNLSITLVPPACPPGGPYCGNTTVSSASGTVWIVNDGGVYANSSLSTPGPSAWRAPAVGLNTLAFNGAAVLARPGSLSGAALYTGTADNEEFFYNPDTSPGFAVSFSDGCGDCNMYFADALQPDRVVHVDQSRQPQFGLHKSLSGGYPPLSNTQPVDDHVYSTVPYPLNGYDENGAPTRVTGFASGSRPVIQTVPGEPLVIPSGPLWIDLATLGLDTTTSPASPALFRSRIVAVYGVLPLDLGWAMISPPLPTGSGTPVEVQAGGGHAAPTYYVRTSAGALFQGISPPGSFASVSGWTQRDSVPCEIGQVSRFFVNPYKASQLYAVDGGYACPPGLPNASVFPPGIRVSTDGGATWNPESNLSAALTNNGEFAVRCPGDPFNCLLNHVLFVPNEPWTIFAAGITGVFGTVDGGANWARFLDSSQLPCDAGTLGFDNLTAGARTLYVFCYGRGALRIGGIPSPSP